MRDQDITNMTYELHEAFVERDQALIDRDYALAQLSAAQDTIRKQALLLSIVDKDKKALDRYINELEARIALYESAAR